MKKALLLLLALTFLLVIFIFFQKTSSSKSAQNPEVIVSTFSQYDIVKHLVDDEIELKMLIPFGQDIHSFEPTPKDMISISKSALFIYSGAGLEPWIKGTYLAKNTLDLSTSVHLRSLEESCEHDHDEHHHHEENEFDPHYWLDIDNMISSALGIKIELLKIKEINKEKLEANYLSYIGSLEALKTKYAQKLQSCANPVLVLNHNAFSYIAAKYNFTIESISGLSSDAMPSAKTLVHINEVVKEHNVSTIFYERFVSDKVMQSISAQSGAKVSFLQALANITADDAQAQKSYVMFMEENLEKISEAMQCR